MQLKILNQQKRFLNWTNYICAYQADIGVQTHLNVFPVKLHSSRSYPQRDHSERKQTMVNFNTQVYIPHDLDLGTCLTSCLCHIKFKGVAQCACPQTD